MKASVKGFNTPLDGHVWYSGNKLGSVPTNFVDHEYCNNPCKTSVRTWLNGDVAEEPK